MEGGNPSPIWLRGVGVFALVAIAAGLGYALAIGILNFARIGV